MRKAFAETLTRLAADDDRILFMTGDLGFETFDEFQRRFGPRYVNVGVAEAQMVCAAAGLALEGWRPVAYSIASFVTGRAYEHIRVSVGYQDAPVVVVGAGGGYLYASSGVTHYAADDLGLMSLIPEMTVVAPADPVEVESLLPQVMRLPGPAYLRIGKYGEPVLTAAGTPELGRARLVKDGERLLVLTTGDIAGPASAALDSLARERITPAHYQVHTVKPLDEATLDRLAPATAAIVVVEEHLPIGGLWSAVCNWKLSRGGATPSLHRVGPQHRPVLGSPGRAELLRRVGCDRPSIEEAIRQIWTRPDGPSAGPASAHGLPR